MDETLNRIQQLSNERQQLWLRAGQGKATPAERRRVREITDELAVLWDRYRREYASRHSLSYEQAGSRRAA